MNKGTKTLLSDYCAKIRAKTGLNKASFAKTVGVSDVQIGKIERGYFDDPSPLMLFRIFKTYNIDSSKISEIIINKLTEEYIEAFNRYYEQDKIDSNTYYLKQHFFDYLTDNKFSIIEPFSYVQDGVDKSFPHIIPHTEYIDYLDIGGKKQNKYIFGYVIKSVRMVRSEENKFSINKELSSLIGNIVNPNYLINPASKPYYNLKPGENNSKFDLYLVTGSKSVFDYLLQLKNTFILLNFNIYCFYSRYEHDYVIEKIN